MGGAHKDGGRNRAGFTLIEIICVLLILGVMALFSTRLFTNLVQGYTLARDSDAAVQKAQNAMQRMTIDFTYLTIGTASGTANSITYTTSLNNALQITIAQTGNAIMYSFGGGSYTLTDGVQVGSLKFSYYNTYDAAADTAMSSNTTLVGFSYTMVGDDPSLGFSQTYSTRVKVGKLQ